MKKSTDNDKPPIKVTRLNEPNIELLARAFTNSYLKSLEEDQKPEEIKPELRIIKGGVK